MLLAKILSELVDDGWPCPVVLEFSKVSTGVIDQLKKHVPCIFLYNLKVFLIVLQEFYPVLEEAAFAC
jgi:hypothetical protein